MQVSEVASGVRCVLRGRKQQLFTLFMVDPFWGAEGAPILFSDLGIRMASCSYIYIYIFLSLQMAALTSFFTKL